jgi:hypothetical protein
MRSLVRGGGRLRRIVLAAGSLAWAVSVSFCRADSGPSGEGSCPTCRKPLGSHHKPHGVPAAGTLGYGPPGVYPGFQGFGLGYHPGYGFGGQALGVGVDGGYPFYGGPGYPHPWPTLRRLCGINPFPHYGGPGGPVPGHPNYFAPTGPLAPDRPVVVHERDPRDPAFAADYGGFTGTVPYPETTFAPFLTIDATDRSSSSASSGPAPNAPPNTAPAPGEVLDERAASRSLGVDAGPFVTAGRERGLKVTWVQPGGPAEKAGFCVGDLIRSANGHVTEQPGHLAWIIAHAPPDKVLKISVRAANDGQVRSITAKLP